MAGIDLGNVAAAAQLIAVVTPPVMAAYSLLREIWLANHPGKTEEDFLAMLQDASQKNIDDAGAILAADGWTQDADGHWVRPPSP